MGHALLGICVLGLQQEVGTDYNNLLLRLAVWKPYDYAAFVSNEDFL